METVLFVTTILVLWRSAVATLEYVSLDKDGCYGLQRYKVNDARYVEIVWSGGSMTTDCFLTFFAFPEHLDNISDRYKICVQVLLYDVSQCDFKLELSSKDTEQQNYTCNRNDVVPSTKKQCYKEGTNVSLLFKFEGIQTSNSNINIRVTASLTYRRKKGKTYHTHKVLQKYPLAPWKQAVIAVGVIAMVAIVACIGCWLKRK